MLDVKLVKGDLFEQRVDVIVNPWNRNFIPWWLLLPQGVSGQLKKKAGSQPFKELSKFGVLKLGDAVMTTAGKLQYKCIIHVAGINCFWFATKKSITLSVKNALDLAHRRGFKSIAFPVIGSGSGNFSQDKAKNLMLNELKSSNRDLAVILVEYCKNGDDCNTSTYS